jgi:hypothetical protein
MKNNHKEEQQGSYFLFHGDDLEVYCINILNASLGIALNQLGGQGAMAAGEQRPAGYGVRMGGGAKALC